MDLVLPADKDNYCVMGNPVAHSVSPAIHARFAAELQQPVHYQALLAPRDDFAATLMRFFEAGGKGCNITLPFKQQALGLADRISQRARQAGAVNTLARDPAGLIRGDSTDGIGLMRDLAHKHIHLAGKTVLIAGAGGVVHSVMAPLLHAGPERITIANRTLAHAEAIVALFGGSEAAVSCCAYQALRGRRFEVVFNATSAGLLTGEVPLPDGILASRAVCYDLAYGKAARPFLDWAEHNGAALRTDGLGMLVEQAAESFYLWRGVRPETAGVLAGLQAQM